MLIFVCPFIYLIEYGARVLYFIHRVGTRLHFVIHNVLMLEYVCDAVSIVVLCTCSCFYSREFL